MLGSRPFFTQQFGVEALTERPPVRVVEVHGNGRHVEGNGIDRTIPPGPEAIATQPMREDHAEGQHTTRCCELHPPAGGCLVIGTPGMRELQPTDAASGIARGPGGALGQCRFSDCRHETEPDDVRSVVAPAMPDVTPAALCSSYPRAKPSTRRILNRRGLAFEEAAAEEVVEVEEEEGAAASAAFMPQKRTRSTSLRIRTAVAARSNGGGGGLPCSMRAVRKSTNDAGAGRDGRSLKAFYPRSRCRSSRARDRAGAWGRAGRPLQGPQGVSVMLATPGSTVAAVRLAQDHPPQGHGVSAAGEHPVAARQGAFGLDIHPHPVWLLSSVAGH